MTLRMLHVLESLEHSGAARQAALLAARLPRDEFEVHVCTLGPGGARADELAARGVPVTALGRRWRWDPTILWRLRREVTRLRPRIVHTWEFDANTFGRLAASDASKLVAGERHVDLWKRWPETKVDAYLARRTDRIVTDSTAVRDFYLLRQGYFHPEKIAVIPPAVEPSSNGRVQPPGLIEELHDDEAAMEGPLMAAVGSLTSDRRVRDLIGGLELLAFVVPGVRLLILGDGPQRRLIERYAASVYFADRVHVLGPRDARGLWPHVRALWSGGEQDGIPAAVLEAMAAGVPVVASDTPGHRDLITPGETGLLFPVGDRAGLARCALRLLQTPLFARQLAQQAQQRVLTEFGPEKMIERHAEVYRELMG